MRYIDNVNVRRSWEECPREAKEARWAQLYATLNPDGDIVISAFTHKTLGAPDSYLLLFDRERSVIGLRPARSAVEKNAYPARDRGRHGGRGSAGTGCAGSLGSGSSGRCGFTAASWTTTGC